MPQAAQASAPRKFWAAASLLACMVAVSGCEACDGNILNVGGAKLDAPATVQPGTPATFSVSGQIGKTKKCPEKIQLTYVELSAKGQPLRTAASSRGAAKEMDAGPVTKTSGGCALRDPVKIPLTISPGRHDQHRVRVTASLHGPAPKIPPKSKDPLADLAKIFVELSVGEDSKIVTVQGTVPAATNSPPVPAFIYSQSPAVTGQPLGLDARQSKDPDGSIVKYDWDLDGDGTFEKSSTSPTGVQVDSAAADNQPIKLRVTDDKGAQGVSSQVSVPSSGSGFQGPYEGGTPTLSPELTGPGKPITVGVRTTSPAGAESADLFCNDTLTSTLSSPTTGETFPQPCTFATAGFGTIAVRYSDSASSSFPYLPTVYYRLGEIVPGARAAAKKASLRVPLSLSGAKLKTLGKLKLESTSGTIKGLVATGTGKGKVPKGTPKRFRAALKTLASGRFALRFTGSGKLDSTTINLSGSATMLVRSRKSRKTQVCLSVKAAGGGGQARFKVRGATGRARGFGATGTGPPVSFDKGTGRSATVSLSPRKGKARGLTRSCRSLSKVLDGKKRKR